MNDSASTAQDRRRVVMTRKIRLGEDDGSFDREFWDYVGPAGKFEAAWAMICDLVRWGKLREDQLRLQRSVVRVVRREGPPPTALARARTGIPYQGYAPMAGRRDGRLHVLSRDR